MTHEVDSILLCLKPSWDEVPISHIIAAVNTERKSFILNNSGLLFRGIKILYRTFFSLSGLLIKLPSYSKRQNCKRLNRTHCSTLKKKSSWHSKLLLKEGMQSLHTFEDQNVNMLSYRGNSIQITIVKRSKSNLKHIPIYLNRQKIRCKRHYEFVLYGLRYNHNSMLLYILKLAYSRYRYILS